MKSFETELELSDLIEYDENNQPIPEVEIVKDGNRYAVYNIKTPHKKYYFDTKEELYYGIGSPARRPHQFRDLTGENLFIGR